MVSLITQVISNSVIMCYNPSGMSQNPRLVNWNDTEFDINFCYTLYFWVFPIYRILDIKDSNVLPVCPVQIPLAYRKLMWCTEWYRYVRNIVTFLARILCSARKLRCEYLSGNTVFCSRAVKRVKPFIAWPKCVLISCCTQGLVTVVAWVSLRRKYVTGRLFFLGGGL